MTIAHNVVQHSDLDYEQATSECSSSPTDSDECGDSNAPFQDVNGNRVLFNFFGRTTPPATATRVDMATTGIILVSLVVAVTHIVVVGNVLANNTYGIWQTANIAATGLSHNAFVDVGTNVFTH